MQLKNTIPIILASFIGGLADQLEISDYFIIPITDNYSNHQISYFIIVLIFLSALFLVLYIILSKSNTQTSLKLKFIKFFMITPLCIALFLGVGIILPDTLQKKPKHDQKIELLNKQLKIAETKLSLKPNFIADELIKLNQLKESGILTEEEFEEEKKRVLKHKETDSLITKKLSK